jgi:hypothetical protein
MKLTPELQNWNHFNLSKTIIGEDVID